VNPSSLAIPVRPSTPLAPPRSSVERSIVGTSPAYRRSRAHQASIVGYASRNSAYVSVRCTSVPSRRRAARA
jgi:hypothetical protein